MKLKQRIERLEGNSELSDNFSCVHIYNPENKEVIHTSKTRISKNAQSVHLYLPHNGRDSID